MRLPVNLVRGLRFRLTLSYLLLFSALLVVIGLYFRHSLEVQTEGDVRDWAYHRLDWLLGAVIVVLIAVFAFALATQLRVLDRWLADLRLISLQLLGVIAVVGLVIGVRQRRDGVAEDVRAPMRRKRIMSIEFSSFQQNGAF